MTIGIIGAGATGLMTAATILELHPSARVVLVEKNDGLGKKVIISGGGRCNVTTGIHDIRAVLTKYPRGGKFLSSAMYNFPPEAVYAWFEAHGVPLKTEEDLRVFPQSNNGKDIVRVFETLFNDARIEILLKAHVTGVEKQGDVFVLTIKDRETPLLVDKLVLTTGGQAYRHTGSTGDGYAFATSLGHTLTNLAPSLNSFFTRETWPAEISGLSFKQATISVLPTSSSLTQRSGDREPALDPIEGSIPSAPMGPRVSVGLRTRMTGEREDHRMSHTGPFLFTHKGVSGPAVFAVSSQVAFETYDPKQPLEIAIDVFPEESVDELRSTIEQLIKDYPKKSTLNVLAHLVSKSFAEVLCIQLSLTRDKHAAELSKQDILRVVTWIKAIPLHVIGRGAGDEFVTAGGVQLKEVDPTTMESKICPGLFFAGEILDIDGYTGGFNLQASWATGRLVGENAGC